MFGKRKKRLVEEKETDPQSCMFGVGVMPDESAPLTPTSVYQSQLEEAHDPDFEAVSVEASGETTSSSRPRLTLFDFALPVLRYLSVLLSGLILSKLAASLPSLLPSPAFIASVTHYISLFVLFFNFLPSLGKTYTGPLSGLLPSPRIRRLDPVGRRILRRYGRAGWFIWRFTQPLWGLLMLGCGCMAVFGAGIGLRALWNALPSVQDAKPAPVSTQRPTLFGNDDDSFGKTVKSCVRICRTLMFFSGFIFLLFGIINYMTERPWAAKITGALMSWSMAAMLTFMDGVTIDEGDPGTFLGN